MLTLRLVTSIIPFVPVGIGKGDGVFLTGQRYLVRIEQPNGRFNGRSRVIDSRIPARLDVEVVIVRTNLILIDTLNTSRRSNTGNPETFRFVERFLVIAIDDLLASHGSIRKAFCFSGVRIDRVSIKETRIGGGEVEVVGLLDTVSEDGFLEGCDDAVFIGIGVEVRNVETTRIEDEGTAR